MSEGTRDQVAGTPKLSYVVERSIRGDFVAYSDGRVTTHLHMVPDTAPMPGEVREIADVLELIKPQNILSRYQGFGCLRSEPFEHNTTYGIPPGATYMRSGRRLEFFTGRPPEVADERREIVPAGAYKVAFNGTSYQWHYIEDT